MDQKLGTTKLLCTFRIIHTIKIYTELNLLTCFLIGHFPYLPNKTIFHEQKRRNICLVKRSSDLMCIFSVITFASGSPFRCVVDKVGAGYVTAYGHGLNFASSGQETSFTVISGSSK